MEILATDLGSLVKWLTYSTVSTASVLSLLAYVFREKWKQMLAKSLAAEMEQLKHELVLKQQENAASLAPQLEAVKHDFQIQLESYKTSLIAQAEAIKAKTDIRKTLAVRFSEMNFERLLVLESRIPHALAKIAIPAAFHAEMRTNEQQDVARAAIDSLWESISNCEMFLTIEERELLLKLQTSNMSLLKHIGIGREAVDLSGELCVEAVNLSLKASGLARQKLKELADLTPT